MTDFLRPILQWASGRSAEFVSREAAEAMAGHFNFSDKAGNELTLGDLNRVDNRTGWSITHLKVAKLLRHVRGCVFEITQAGRNEAFSSDERMTPAYLENKFPSYRKYRERIKDRKNKKSE